jgi:hypothetical protein
MRSSSGVLRNGGRGVMEQRRDTPLLIAAFATLAVLTLSPAQVQSAGGGRQSPARTARALAPPRARLPIGDVYSARAKRRMASYLRMRLLELREQGLRRAIEVIEGRMSVDDLLRMR